VAFEPVIIDHQQNQRRYYNWVKERTVLKRPLRGW
jgi:hypothetical protein